MSMKTARFGFRYALAFIILFAVEAYIAVFIHDDFIRPYIGDVLVVIWVYCFLRIFIIRSIKLLPLYVFLFASCIEAAQYFNLVGILGLKDNRVAGIILGSVFDIKDILCYLAGCILLFIYQGIAWRFKVRRKWTDK